MAITTGYNVSNVYLEIDGKGGGFLSSFTPPTYEVEQINQRLGVDGTTKKALGNPKIGQAVATFSIAQGDTLLDWVARVLGKNSAQANVAVVLADQNFQVRRRVEFPGCLITGVEFSALDAREAKKAFEVTVTFQPEGIKFEKGSGKLNAAFGTKAKNWLVSNFQVEIPDLDTKYVTRVELPKFTAKIAQENAGTVRLPTSRYASYEIDGLRIDHAPLGFDAAQGFVTKVLQDGVIAESEYTTMSVRIYDQTMKQVIGTFTAKGCAPRKFTWSADAKAAEDRMGTSCIEFFVQEFALERK